MLTPLQKDYNQEHRSESANGAKISLARIKNGSIRQAEIANELGAPNTTLSTWVKRYKDNSEKEIVGSQVLIETVFEIRKY